MLNYMLFVLLAMQTVFPTEVLLLKINCLLGDITFSITQAHRLERAQNNIIIIKNSVLSVEECIEHCKSEKKCFGFNFVAGQKCQLLTDSVHSKSGNVTATQTWDGLTISGKKICIPGLHKNCLPEVPWAIETFPEMAVLSPQKSMNSSSEMDCLLKCLKNKNVCSSASYQPSTSLCHLSSSNLSSSRSKLMAPELGSVYLDPGACFDPGTDTCGMTEMTGKIQKIVNSVVGGVLTKAQCKNLCKQSKFRCRSFDWNEIGFGVCRLSHHTTQSLRFLESPYLSKPGARTYEMNPCYNVTVLCTADSMIVRVVAQSVFRGKIYTKTRPHSCMLDVRSSNEFELNIGYKDVRCAVQRDQTSGYTADVIIQHHDVVITSLDVGFHARCEYGMNNLHVKTAFQLPEDIYAGEDDDRQAAAAALVAAPPNITMRIADQHGNSINTAKIGDTLSLIFEIEDSSPFRMYIKDLLAMDGTDTNQIQLIDSTGCPSNPGIMESLEPLHNTNSLKTKFDAFKFPSSDTVQFQALVTLCMPTCHQVKCPPHHVDYEYYNVDDDHDNNNKTNLTRQRRMAEDTKTINSNQTQTTVIVASLMLKMDKFPFNDDHKQATDNAIDGDQDTENMEESVQSVHEVKRTVEGPSGVLVWIVLLCVQMIVLILWLWAYKRHKRLILEF